MVLRARMLVSCGMRGVWLAVVFALAGAGCFREEPTAPEQKPAAPRQETLPNTGEAETRAAPPAPPSEQPQEQPDGEEDAAPEGESAEGMETEAEAAEGAKDAADTPGKPEEDTETPESEAEEPEQEEEEEPEKPAFTRSRLEQIEEGMSYRDVVAKAGPPGLTVVTKGADTTVYKWNKQGVSFLARFSEGKLVRKTVVEMPEEMRNADNEEEKKLLTEVKYDQVTQGMELDEVLSLLETDVQVVSDSNRDVAIYKWVDDQGSSFTARFEEGRLVRKTGMYVAPLKEEENADEEEAKAGDSEEEGEEEAEKETEAETTPEGEAEGEAAMGEGEWVEGESTLAPQPIRGQRRNLQQLPPATGRQQRPQVAQGPGPQVQSIAPPSRVRIVGGGREREPDTGPGPRGSYKPKAKLPDFAHSLRRGSYEVRIRNTADTRAKVGLRGEKRGRDLNIPPGGTKSVNVDRGTYQLYYIYSDDPYTLHHGQSIPIDGLLLADVEVTLFGQETEIGVLDYSQDLR